MAAEAERERIAEKRRAEKEQAKEGREQKLRVNTNHSVKKLGTLVPSKAQILAMDTQRLQEHHLAKVEYMTDGYLNYHRFIFCPGDFASDGQYEKPPDKSALIPRTPVVAKIEFGMDDDG